MDEAVSVAADLVINDHFEIVSGCEVGVTGSKISSIGVASAPGTCIRLPGTVLVPGLLNAHTHLELTYLKGKLKPTPHFAEWLKALVRKRFFWGKGKFLRSARAGAQLCLESGTTTVGDITSTLDSPSVLVDVPIRKVVFLEAIGPDPAKAKQATDRITTALERERADRLLQLGLSPHAPYSACAEVYEWCAATASQRELLLATHLAETREELDFLEEGKGALFDVMARHGLLPAGWEPPGCTPVEYVDRLGVLSERTILVHCNYVTSSDVERIARSGASVVYCPRSHHFFGHSDHPFRRLMERGVNVALGTDSLASNTSLSMLDEMRFVCEQSPDVEPKTVWRMATVAAAKALGLEGQVGTISVGKEADMVGLKLKPGSTVRTVGDVLRATNEVSFVMIGGTVALDRNRR